MAHNPGIYFGTSDAPYPDADLTCDFHTLFDTTIEPYQDQSIEIILNNNDESSGGPPNDNAFFPYADQAAQWPIGPAPNSFVTLHTGVPLDSNPDALPYPATVSLPSSLNKPGPRSQFHKPFVNRLQNSLDVVPEESIVCPELAPLGHGGPTGVDIDAYTHHPEARGTSLEQSSSGSYVPRSFYDNYDYTGYVDAGRTIAQSISSSGKRRRTDDCDSEYIRLSSSTMTSDCFSASSVPYSRSSMASGPTTARSSMSSFTTPPASYPPPSMTPFHTLDAASAATPAMSTLSTSIPTIEEDPTEEEQPYVCPGCNLGDPESLPQRQYGGRVRQQRLKGTFVGKKNNWYSSHLKGVHIKLFKPDNDPDNLLCRLCPCAQGRCGARFADWDALFSHVRDCHSQPMSIREVHCHACPPLSRSLVRKLFRR